MTRRKIPSHLEIAHYSWEKVLHKQATVIDATCGNGHDTLFVCKNLGFEKSNKDPLEPIPPQSSKVSLYCIDIQKQAIRSTTNLLAKNEIDCTNISFIQDCHSKMDSHITCLADLIIYNLGYLPGSDKSVKTLEETSLLSIKKSLTLLKPEGLLSITCYPGHKEGLIEQKAIFSFIQTLDQNVWSTHCYHSLFEKAPILLLLYKKTKLP